MDPEAPKCEFLLLTVEMMIAITGFVAFCLGSFSGLSGLLYVSPVFLGAMKDAVMFIGDPTKKKQVVVSFLFLAICFLFIGMDTAYIFVRVSALENVLRTMSIIYPAHLFYRATVLLKTCF